MKQKRLILVFATLAIALATTLFLLNQNDQKSEAGEDLLSMQEFADQGYGKIAQQLEKKLNHEKRKIDLPRQYKRGDWPVAVSNADVLKIVNISTDDVQKLEAAMAAIKNADFKSNRDKVAKWDINKTPTSNHEYKLWVAELNDVALTKFSEAVAQNDKKKALQAAYASMTMQFFNHFDYYGYDEKGRLIIQLPGEKTALMKSVVSKYRLVAGDAEPEARSEDQGFVEAGMGLYSMKGGIPASDEAAAEALDSLKADQTPYEMEISGRSIRKKIYSRGDPLSNKAFEWIDYLVDLTSNLGLANDPLSFHLQNMQMMETMKSQLRRYPHSFGYGDATYAELQQLSVANISFEMILRQIIHSRSKHAALWGAGLSSVFGNALGNMINSTRAWSWAILGSLGIETVFMTLATYQGLRQIYVMHRYHSFVHGAMKAAEFKNEPFNLLETKKRFDPTTIYFDEYFRRDAIRAWGLALGMGSLVKYKLNRPAVEAFVRSITMRLIRSSRSGIGMYFRPALKVFASLITSKTWERLLVKMLPKTSAYSAHHVVQASRLINKAPFFAPTNLFMTAIDFGVTSISMYTITYSLLHHTSLALTQTDTSPSMPIQVSLASFDERNEKFYEATQKVLYPLCAELAIRRGLNVFETIEAERKKRKTACKNLIAGLEGWDDVGVLSKKFPALHYRLTSDETHLIDHYKVMKLITAAYEYPDDYKVVWLSALRSIFTLDHVPEIYWSLQLRLLVDPDHGLDSSFLTLRDFFRTPNVQKNFMNLERLNYTIELLAVDTYRLQNKEKNLSRTDKSIAAEIPSIERAWLDYVAYYQHVTKANVEKLAKVRAERTSVGFWGALLDTGLALTDSVAWGWSMMWANPRDWNFYYRSKHDVADVQRFTEQAGQSAAK